MSETWVRSLDWDDPLEKGTATHSSMLAWRIPWTVLSMGSQRVGHNWATFTQSLKSYILLDQLCQYLAKNLLSFYEKYWYRVLFFGNIFVRFHFRSYVGFIKPVVKSVFPLYSLRVSEISVLFLPNVFYRIHQWTQNLITNSIFVLDTGLYISSAVACISFDKYYCQDICQLFLLIAIPDNHNLFFPFLFFLVSIARFINLWCFPLMFILHWVLVLYWYFSLCRFEGFF